MAKLADAAGCRAHPRVLPSNPLPKGVRVRIPLGASLIRKVSSHEHRQLAILIKRSTYATHYRGRLPRRPGSGRPLSIRTGATGIDPAVSRAATASEGREEKGT